MFTNEQANKFTAEIERFMNNRALTPSSDNLLDLNTLSLSAIVLGHLDAYQAPDVFIGAASQILVSCAVTTRCILETMAL